MAVIVGVSVAGVPPALLAIVGIATAVVALALWRPLWVLLVIVLLGPFFALIRTQLVEARPEIPSQVITGAITLWLALTVVAATLRLRARRSNSRVTAADAALVFLLLLQLPFLFLSLDLVIALTALRFAFEGTLAYAFIRIYRPTDREVWLLVGAILASSAILAVSAVVQAAAGPEYIRTYVEVTLRSGVQEVSGGYVRSPSLVGSPNTASWIFLLAIVLSSSLITRVREVWLRALLGLMACLLAAGMVLTFVRASWLGLVVAGLYLLAMSRMRQKPLVTSALAVIVAGSVALALTFADRLPTFIGAVLQNPLYQYDSLRFSQWQDGLSSLLLNPFGHGLGTQGVVSQRFLPIPGERDNWYLKLALESGVLAFGAFVAFMTFVFVAARSAATVTRAPIRALVIGCSASLAGFAIVNVFSNGWDWYPANLYYWVIAAIIVHFRANLSEKPSYET